MESETPVPVPVQTPDVSHDIFVATGCDEAEAGRIAVHLVGANLAGHDSHGVVRVPRYLEWLEAGYVLKNQSAEIVTDGGSFVVFGSRFGFGRPLHRKPWRLESREPLPTGSA
jgi:uncharacterized oxidoreductase